MKKLLISIIFLLIFNTNITFSAIAYNGFNDTDLITLSNIEKNLFGRNYSNLSPEIRLRLAEQRLFGTTQPGTVNNRINFMNNVILNNQNAMINPNISNIRKRNLLKYKLNELLYGNMTGFTPQLHNQNILQSRLQNAYNFSHLKNPYPYGNGFNNYLPKKQYNFNGRLVKDIR